jgi:hypothetical protein
MAYRFDAFNSNDEVFISPELWVPDRIGKIKIVRQYGRFVIVRPIGVYVEALSLGSVNFPSIVG